MPNTSILAVNDDTVKDQYATPMGWQRLVLGSSNLAIKCGQTGLFGAGPMRITKIPTEPNPATYRGNWLGRNPLM